MAYIPKDARWYIAQVVIELTVAGESRNIVHINHLLVRADSPQEAYEKALRMGGEHETTYLNADKKEVRGRFRGLRNLTVVYDALEDGAELLYEERVGLSQQELAALVNPVEALAIFKPIERSQGPDYGSEEIRREAKRLSESGRPSEEK
jgi:hypothetical protein